MLKSDKITLQVKGCRKLGFFKSKGYDISGDTFEIKINDLNPGSRQLIDVICDFCNKEVSISYREYNRNISIGNKYACSKFCGSEKAKESNLKKYGVENALQLKEIQDKQASTNLEKYGVKFIQQSDVIKEKSRKTNFEKYGKEFYSQTDECRELLREKNSLREKKPKIKKIKLLVNNEDKIKKIKLTKLEKYGDENYNNIVKIKETLSNKNNENWEEIIDKRVKFNKKKYGVDNHVKNEKYRKDKFEIANNTYYIKYIGDSKSLFNCDLGKEHTFEIKTDNYFSRNKLNIPLCTFCNPIGDQKSIKEKDLFEFIKNNYDGEIIQSYRDVLEIDIYLPELKLGFEFNGLYWHSENYKDKNYHLDKSSYFKEKSIHIFNIWEDDWVNKQEIIKSQITNLLGNNSHKIYARKCEILELNSVTDFLNKNHIQGLDRSKIKLGLFYNNELVSVMTFNKLEGRIKMKDNEWNLSRFCNKLNTSVIGGASKLLSYFIKKYKPSRIISYADKDWSQGKLYEILEFVKINETLPDYKYFNKSNFIRIHKQNFKKSKIGIGKEITEKEHMEKLGFYRIWDCGKIKYELLIKNPLI